MEHILVERLRAVPEKKRTPPWTTADVPPPPTQENVSSWWPTGPGNMSSWWPHRPRILQFSKPPVTPDAKLILIPPHLPDLCFPWTRI